MEKIGKYKTIEVLGKGGMGIVYKALDPDIHREVAIKTIRFDLVAEGSEKEDLMGRFMREARAAGKLSHPNIITIYDVGREKDLTYIVMQYVEGPSLQKIIASKKKLSYEEIIKLMDQLCDALDYAHQRGIIHRDIKPANILTDKAGKPFVADFGLARVETSTITQTGTTVGTPSYMSPEQVMGKGVDNRSDIFSLGVVLYELLTGERPFSGDNVTSIIYKIINEEPPSAAEIKKNLPPGFETVIHRSLAKDVKNRYKSCRHFLEDLHNLDQLSDPTLTLALDETEFAGLKKGRKRKLGLILVISFSAIILAGAGGAYFLSQRTKKSLPLTAEVQHVMTELPPPSLQLKDAIPNPLDEKLNKVKERFENEDYDETVRLAEEILTENKDNVAVQDYLNQAKSKLNENLTTQVLEAGIDSYKKGDYKQCLLEMEKVLKIDKENKEANRYAYLADTAISKREILRIVERQRKAEEEKDLLSLLDDVGTSTLSGQRKADAMLLFNYYDDIKSSVSNVSVNFRNRNQASVSFSYILTAVYKKTGQKTGVSEGVKTWLMEKQRNVWKIIDIK